MGSGPSTSKSTFIIGDKPVETAFMAVTELIKVANVGDIVELGNNLFGIVTQKVGDTCKVATSVNGKIQEVAIQNMANEGKINNSFDKTSAPYGSEKVVQNARNFVGQIVSDSHSFVKKCRNGI
ncbi:hypothetical protein WR25_06594 [Diploscapter pachys]|uniref:Uncharacterized protein n=1 Tax=Diploscapter pachys TaxID=2018661 RepID=A0A2A2KT91_9BILA|nr:hypothetical protein WR25_06594 [Diploscapter pachys]